MTGSTKSAQKRIWLGGVPLVPGTGLNLFVGLVTFRHLFTILYLPHTFPRTIFCLLPRAGNLRGVSYPWEDRCGVTRNRKRRKQRNRK